VIEGLGEEVERAGLHRLDRAVDPAMGRDDDHGHVRMARNHLAKQGEAVHAGHDQIGDHHVRTVAVEGGDRLLAVGANGHLVAFALQRGGEDLAEALLVVHDEDAVGHRGVCAITQGREAANLTSPPAAWSLW